VPFRLSLKVKKKKDPELVDIWRKLQTSDHFYYMCTKWFADGDVHKYFNPYESPYDGYINFMNVLADFSNLLEERYKMQKDAKDTKEIQNGR